MEVDKKVGGEVKRIVILGGGPAGVACALTLKRLEKDTGSRIGISIVEGKQFSGEKHYNPCVGVLSPNIPSLLEKELGIPFPHDLSRGEITGYILHTYGEMLALSEDQPSISLRRVHFDAYMLEAARERGVELIRARAVDLELHDSCVIVYTENEPIKADVVVGAFGLDEGSSSMLARVTPYRPPKELSSVLTKVHPGPEAIDNFGSCIHAFLPVNPRVEFAAITPKGNHLTINIAGKNVDEPLMRRFLSHPQMREFVWPSELNHPDDWRFFKGRFPSSLAHNFYGDRYVVVGDAAGLVRPFKGKGVSSAILSGVRAARTIMLHGVTKQAFHRYYRPANHDITDDLIYGRLARLATIYSARYRLLDPVLRAAAKDEKLQSALSGAVSGYLPYRDVLARTLAPRAALSIIRAALARAGNRKGPAQVDHPAERQS